MATQSTVKELMLEVTSLKQRLAEVEAIAAAEQQYHETMLIVEQKYHQLFEYSGDSVLIIDLLTERIIEANSTAARRLRYTSEELLTLTLSDLEVALEKTRGIPSYLWKSSFSGTRVYECSYRRKDDVLIPVEVSSRMVRIGEQDVLQNVVRDISKRKQIELDREQLIEELDAFAHTVAHDLKNPLAVVMNFAALLAEDPYSIRPEDLQTISNAIQNGSQKLLNIIDELLLLAGVRKQADITVFPVEMRPVIDGALHRLPIMIQEYGAEIHITEEAFPVVFAYAPWLEEIWTNYLSNAIKYGGTPPVITIGATIESPMVRFWVSDNGNGISAESIPLLFNQFSRPGETRIDGYGLGLSIVRRIVNRLGGDVSVETSIGQGSIFSFTLPLANQAGDP